MQDPSYRWVVVAAGGLIGCVAMGALFALPVLLNPMVADTGWSRTGISGAMTVAFLAMALCAMLWGAASDRFGARPAVLLGAGLFTLALVLASRAQSLLQFQLAFGGLGGATVAAFIAPMMATVTGWFSRQTALAVSLVSAGMGLAPVTMSPLVAWLIGRQDWREVLLLLAGIVAILTLPAALLLRRPPQLIQPEQSLSGPGPHDPRSLRQVVVSAPFLVLVAANFFCCATHSGPIFHTVSYAELCGLSTIAAVSIYSVEGIAGMAGRLGFGLLGDRFGAKRVLVSGLLAQALAAMLYVFAGGLYDFYAVAALFGFIYAGTMPLYAVLVRENFPLRMMGTIIGATSMAGGLGMATGPVLGGWIFDRTGGYAGMYFTSLGLGLVATLVMLTFRPIPQGAAAETPPTAA